MKPQLYEQTANIEDQHWWHQSRLELVAQYINKMNLEAAARILDVGCGTGGTTRFLEQYGQVTGIDKSKVAVEHARKKARKTVFVEGDGYRLDQLFPPNSFDLVTFFNVICHQWVPDDLQMLARVKDVLKPQGYVLLTEPAYKILRRRHDTIGMVKTRYNLSDFERYFAESGIEYKWGRYFNAIAFPICLAMAFKDKFFRNAGTDQTELKELMIPWRPINSTMKVYMQMERWLFTRIPFPVGVTLLVVGQKKIGTGTASKRSS